MNGFTPFAPHYGSGQIITAAAATPGSVSISQNNSQVRLSNPGTNVVYVRVGEGDQTAKVTAADFPVFPGQTSTITKPVGESGTGISPPLQLGYLSPLGTTLSVITGNGF